MASQKEIQEQAARIAIFRAQMNQVVAEVEGLFNAVAESKGFGVFIPANIDRALSMTEKNAKLALARAQAAADTGFVNGVPATFDQIKEITLQLSTAVDEYTKAVDAWNAVSYSEYLVEGVQAVRSAMLGIVKGVTGTVGLLRYLPYIIVGGAILFFVVPPLLRTIRAGRRGGVDEALDVSAGQIEAARAAIGRQYAQKQELATQAAKLYLTKGMVNGAPAGRRRRRSK